MTGEVAGPVDVNDLAQRIDARFPSLTPRGRVVALAVHRALALGQPVPDYGIAAEARLQITEVREEMEGWPGIYRNEAGRVIGFWGLGLYPTEHRFAVDGRELYTWCAWDALFLPEILRREATVQSRCAATGNAIELVVGPDRIVHRGGANVAISFVDPEAADIAGDRVISTFCHHILFFESSRLATAWTAERGGGAFALSLDEAFLLGRRCNALRYGDSIARTAPRNDPDSRT